MDDLGEFLIGIIVAILVIIALIYVFVYVVLPGAFCYYLGKQFFAQMKSFQLVKKTKMVLAIIGGASILIATAIIKDSGLDGFIIVPLSALIFLITAVPTIAIWAYTKKKKFLDVGYSLKSQKNELELKLRGSRNSIERLKKKNQTIRNRFGSSEQEKERLKIHLGELCSMDPRTYTILKREWVEQYKGLGDGEIESLRKELTRKLKRNSTTDKGRKIENGIRLCLIKIEEIGREVRQPYQTLEENIQKIGAIEREKTSLEQKVAKIADEINRNESTYQAFLDSRIVLD